MIQESSYFRLTKEVPLHLLLDEGGTLEHAQVFLNEYLKKGKPRWSPRAKRIVKMLFNGSLRDEAFMVGEVAIGTPGAVLSKQGAWLDPRTRTGYIIAQRDRILLTMTSIHVNALEGKSWVRAWVIPADPEKVALFLVTCKLKGLVSAS